MRVRVRWWAGVLAIGIGSIAPALAAQAITAACVDFLEVEGQVYVRVGFASTEPLVQTNLLEQAGMVFTTHLLPLEETAEDVYTAWTPAAPAGGGEGAFQIADVLTASGTAISGFDLGAALAIYPDAPECSTAATARVPGTDAATVSSTTTPVTVPSTTAAASTTTTTTPGAVGGDSGSKDGFPWVPAALVTVSAAAIATTLVRKKRSPDSRDRVRAAHDTIARAGLSLPVLIDGSEAGMQWSGENIADLAPALDAASRAVSDLHQRFPSAVADAYGSGTMTNIEDTFKFFGGGDLERGCLSHQRVTYEAISGLLAGSSLEVAKVRIGTVLQHNAVVVYPRGKDWKQSGIVLDGWIRQKSALDRMVYRFTDWVSFGDRPRLVP